ncbi:MAG: protein-glutamate O-methyltransferase CheR [Phenylobacterium sp.]|uniref:CheR family methyltransferase n=1 Tax=Phenylobacterium sp. TaxID=1871053 RepID=UPI0027344A96|nr:protein-glutamate O-methyltransferase CheR [Phenylobacterium sp.]MDP3175370.1 protein-glutamate O-methyltransferase CheR [Phenylobacterium sp.]
MKRDDAEMVAHLCEARAGLKVDPAKIYLLESRLAPVARRDGFGSIEEMLLALRTRREERMIWAVVEAMTMGETSFFRDQAPFDHFRDVLLPQLAANGEGRPIRVWSAACGSGQEVYSLAMAVEEQRAHLSGVRVDLFASDLNERALEKAQSGLYTQFEVQRGLHVRRLVQHFEKFDEMWRLSPRIRQMVRWRRTNLVSDLSTLGRFDVIFCRYLLSSLVEPMRKRVIENLALLLEPNGVIYLGVGERLAEATPALRAVVGCDGLFRPDPAYRAAA